VRNKFEVHANTAGRPQNSRTVEGLVKDKYKLDDHVLQAANRLRENKEENKKVMMRTIQVKQMQENQMKRRQDERKEKIQFDKEEQYLDMVAQKRDQDLANHHRRIAERDAEIFNIYNRPE
jgi:hypothetical protein